MFRKTVFHRSFIILAAAIGLAGCAITDELPTPAETFSFSTGNYGGVYYPFGQAACRLWNSSPELAKSRCIAQATGGSVENIERLQAGRTSFGMVQSDALSRLSADYKLVLAGPMEAFAIILNPANDATTLQDLKGKRISIGAEGSGVQLTAQQVFAAIGWTGQDIERVPTPSTGQQARLLCQGKLDAAFYVAASPSAYIAESVTACGGIVAGPGQAVIDRMIASPHYSRFSIPKESYRNMRADVPTFGVRSYIVVRADEPAERVYQMTKLLVQQIGQIQLHHPALKSLTASQMTFMPPGMERHGGAQRFLREAGLVK